MLLRHVNEVRDRERTSRIRSIATPVITHVQREDAVRLGPRRDSPWQIPWPHLEADALDKDAALLQVEAEKRDWRLISFRYY